MNVMAYNNHGFTIHTRSIVKSLCVCELLMYNREFCGDVLCGWLKHAMVINYWLFGVS